MELSVELSFYPFDADFKPPVKDVIAKLTSFADIEVQPNRMSTQVFGEYQKVMNALNQTMAWSFEKYGHCVFVAKYMQGDRRPKTV
ncbi:hypothetical protein BTA51_15060 [Hahella sp. CCB-MM4]|uniref:hypothetical protein n=1 Tax=Hahella sp. (strain CCB-MM4) TaxID=1926491 RepID=UPI000B9BF159|nr:hypothetical protein [Hahella sp. CCB-MM4]OZG72444.1 hypothetical protein BTA51_15060 [Hahella sp. CCB-MM4]